MICRFSKPNDSYYIKLSTIILTCSVLALSSGNHLIQKDLLPFNKSRNLVFTSPSFLYEYMVYINANPILLDLGAELLQAIMKTRITHTVIQRKTITNKLVKQYLRKFTFFYRYYINSYPNDLTTLSRKKINTAAVHGLFLITSL
jgi:predicted metal-dependent peptidase